MAKASDQSQTKNVTWLRKQGRKLIQGFEDLIMEQ
jgi:hypothetical protein